MRSFRILVVLVVLLFLSGNVFSQDSNFNSDDPNTFVFKKVDEVLQKFGYKQFCPDTKTFACPKLSYEKYNGIKGNFISMEPVARKGLSYEFREVVLENGEKFYYASNSKYGVFSKAAPIIRLSELTKNEGLLGEAIAGGSSIKVVTSENRGSYFYIKLSNGVEFRSDQYQIFRKLIKGVSDEVKRDKLSKLLSELHLKYDKIEDIIIAKETGMEDMPIRAYLGFKGTKPWLRMVMKYRGDNWLFANSYIVVADDVRYEEKQVKFKRDHSGGKVWEWLDVSPNPEQLALLDAVAMANEVTVRFKGDKNIADKTMSPKSKKDTSRILEVYENLK